MRYEFIYIRHFHLVSFVMKGGEKGEVRIRYHFIHSFIVYAYTSLGGEVAGSGR